jgi:ammonia channel protein AmtB
MAVLGLHLLFLGWLTLTEVVEAAVERRMYMVVVKAVLAVEAVAVMGLLVFQLPAKPTQAVAVVAIGITFLPQAMAVLE